MQHIADSEPLRTGTTAPVSGRRSFSSGRIRRSRRSTHLDQGQWYCGALGHALSAQGCGGGETVEQQPGGPPVAVDAQVAAVVPCPPTPLLPPSLLPRLTFVSRPPA